jgi:hypothetical protein
VGTWHTPRTSGPTLKSLVQREVDVEVLMDDGKRAGPGWSPGSGTARAGG